MNASTMNPDPGQPTPRSRRSVLLLVATLLALLVLGCNSFTWNLLPHSTTKTDDKVAVHEPLVHPEGAPKKFAIRIPPYIFMSDVELKKDGPPFPELAGLRDQVNRELALLPGTATIQVYLFETPERYEYFIKERYPNLPMRRAFFVSQPPAQRLGLVGPDDLLVYTQWGDRIQQDLRHELTHALLHSVIGPNVPIWLDEGLAEYFELPPDRKGVNINHLQALKQKFKPDLPRLESLKEVSQMHPEEYRESWAWVHFMLNTTPGGAQDSIGLSCRSCAPVPTRRRR